MPKIENPGKRELRAFIDRVNSDPLFRLRFLVDPARTLHDAGIQLNDELKSALQDAVHEYVEKFPNIALLPTGLPPGSKKRGPLVAQEGGEGNECDNPRILII
jgi:hypothetical protein